MTLALDATYSLGKDLSGVGVYSRELLQGLAMAHPETRFLFCYRPHRFLRSFSEPLPANAHRRMLLDLPLPSRATLFHGLNQRLPRKLPRRAVATFHDLFMLTGDYSTPEFRRRFTQQAREAAQRADAIIAVSRFTARQVEELLGVDPARIHVVHHGVRSFPPASLPKEKLILHTGAIQARKNVARLVGAFERLPGDWRLALAGSAGYGAAAILDRIERSPARERIEWHGYVPDSRLGELYARASIFAFPSLDEGFGMPVLEAMAAGVPVLASNRGALAEIAGEVALLVDPEQEEDILAGLKSLIEDPFLCQTLAARGRSHASRFSWKKAVAETWDVYRQVG
jgi:glycosyltransferase involved in cell wall biosynthesis